MRTIVQQTWARRGLFVVVNIIAFLAVFVAIISPIGTFLIDRDRQIAEQQSRVARLQGITAQASSVRMLIDKADTTKDHAEFLHGPNDNVILANLQTQLTAMTQAAGGRVRSIRALQPTSRDGVRYLGAHVDLSGSLQAVRGTVYSIETATPYLLVVGAVIKSSPQANVVYTGTINSAAQPMFDAEFDVVGAVEAEARH
jgi:hypothetical protein